MADTLLELSNVETAYGRSQVLFGVSFAIAAGQMVTVSGDNAHAFQAGLETKGYLLAQGDRRDFVIVDRAGGIHSLGRRIDGMKAAELHEFMAPFDRDSGQFKGLRFIQGGRSRPRRLVYLAGVVAKRFDVGFKAFAQRLAERGKPPKVITVAVMRKLIEAANLVLGRGQPWVKQTQT